MSLATVTETPTIDECIEFFTLISGISPKIRYSGKLQLIHPESPAPSDYEKSPQTAVTNSQNSQGSTQGEEPLATEVPQQSDMADLVGSEKFNKEILSSFGKGLHPLVSTTLHNTQSLKSGAALADLPDAFKTRRRMAVAMVEGHLQRKQREYLNASKVDYRSGHGNSGLGHIKVTSIRDEAREW
ncbi:hypothetical protein BGZ63DRAFT_10031 [Mariannaea sp. PMI_226]|nr:hypothetical protein BGZ63DRAFT_10031 [Mariannaea sp. PMI_226]